MSGVAPVAGSWLKKVWIGLWSHRSVVYVLWYTPKSRLGVHRIVYTSNWNAVYLAATFRDRGVCEMNSRPRKMRSKQKLVPDKEITEDLKYDETTHNKVSALKATCHDNKLCVWQEVFATRCEDEPPTACVQSGHLCCRDRYCTW